MNIGIDWDQSSVITGGDDPNTIVEDCVQAHKKLINGFAGDIKIPKDMIKEALNPIHAAISLEGEPTLYDRLSDLVYSFKRHGFRSVFIVTNGTNPDALRKLSYEPSQLYVSLCAPDEETYRVTCRPIVSGLWENVLESLELLQSYSCPTVIRHTLLPNLNMKNIEGYAKLDENANPIYIESKAAMSVGYARLRFGYDEMARHSDIQNFSAELAKLSGYNLVDEQWQSNVVLLSRLDEPMKFSS